MKSVKGKGIIQNMKESRESFYPGLTEAKLLSVISEVFSEQHNKHEQFVYYTSPAMEEAINQAVSDTVKRMLDPNTNAINAYVDIIYKINGNY